MLSTAGILEHAYEDDSPAPAPTDDSGQLTRIRKHFNDSEDYCLWELRGLWTNRRARELVGLLLYERIRELGLSAHDARILVTFIAERMYVGRHYVVRTLPCPFPVHRRTTVHPTSNMPYHTSSRSQTSHTSTSSAPKPTAARSPPASRSSLRSCS